MDVFPFSSADMPRAIAVVTDFGISAANSVSGNQNNLQSINI